MTDAAESLARSFGHELRNALNGVVVNLEVVRAQTARAQVSAEPFMGQAVSQSEEAIRLSEAATALMILFAKSLPAASVNAVGDEKKALCLDAGNERERVEKALAPLVARRVVTVETSGSMVILRIPDDSPE